MLLILCLHARYFAASYRRASVQKASILLFDELHPILVVAEDTLRSRERMRS